ncbi:MAG: universal stress protein [Silicimonas sp.]|nr:universal stress protein [Silicimonas sp.]
MYKNILVPIDPSHEERHDVALEMAEHLADADDAVITAAIVIEPVPSYIGMTDRAGELETHAIDYAKASLAKFSQRSPRLKSAILHGSPGNEIVEYAEKNDIDCIVIASHKPGLADYLLGSTAARVVRHVRCNVHVLR